MGKIILTLAARDAGLRIAGAVEMNGHECLGMDAGEAAGIGPIRIPVTEDLGAVAPECDVIIDFSGRAAGPGNASTAASLSKPIVIGTTGMTGDDMRLIRAASRSVPCLVSPNMSVGVNLLFKLCGEAAGVLGEDYDVEIIEAHHRHKKDAPSGTAKRLVEIVAQGRGRALDGRVVHGREGDTGERPRGDIGVHSIRGGDIVGEHTVCFAGPGERIELVHRARSREPFALGALLAAKWIVGKRPGLYDMGDVLDKNDKGDLHCVHRQG